jgi:hypothetical protein
MAEGGKKHGKVSTNGADLEKGQARDFMARDAAASEMSVQIKKFGYPMEPNPLRVLYIQEHDKVRLDERKKIRLTM